MAKYEPNFGGNDKMILTLKKDPQGNFIPATNEELAAALAVKDGFLEKHNEPDTTQSVLLTAIQGANDAKHVTLEEMGL